ncbi:MAG: class I SAM-dependent methyltransferase [Deltaproteobacteria bacterium]|nr:class I SAM-dependent methyltransferase [Deltaproteobacteria bacterium]
MDTGLSGAAAGAAPCPACGSAATAFFAYGWDSEYCTSRERFAYRRCASCATLFLHPPPRQRLHEIYPASYYSFAGDQTAASFIGRLKARLDGRLFRRLLAALPGERLRVLDVGGGNGWLLGQVRAQDARVVETHEVDIDEQARAAAERAGHVYHCLPIEQFAPAVRFDLVVMLNIIEHVADPGGVLRAVAAALTDDGVVLLKTPNTDTLDRRLFAQHNWGGFHCPRHWVLFTAPGFAALARRCGLQPVWIRYTQGAPQWTNSVLGWLADRGWVAVSAERPMHRHPLHAPLLAAFAAFDMARAPFAKTAQMFVLLRKARR